MGVTIHYTGELTSPKVLPKLMDELQELGKEANWEIDSIAPDIFHLPGKPPVRAQGLLIKVHPEAESLNMIFNDKGELVYFLYLIANSIEPNHHSEKTKSEDIRLFIQEPDGEIVEKDDFLEHYDKYGMFQASTKTQFAGPLAHITLCKLLRYLKSKYFRRLEVNDEGEYWQTGETEILVEKMNIINYAIGQMTEFFESYPVPTQSKDMDVESLLTDLQDFLQKVNKNLPHKGR